MTKSTNADLPTLLGEIVRDSGTLVSQQVDLLRVEMKQELRRVGTGIGSMAAGGGLAAAGGLLSGMMLAHLLHRTTRLPLWGCYGIVGGAIGTTGIAMVRVGGKQLATLGLPQTTEAVTENVAWLKEQVTPAH